MACSIISGNLEKSSNDVVKKTHKCPEYILKAQQRQYNKKKNEDPDFLEKERERNRKYREANREHVNELARIRRRNKKLEAQKALSKDETPNNNVEELNIEKLQL
jgi:hypothetical protein